ncbi:MAG: carboxypeptidase regulatory-like domain-containing protein [Ignavibacteria bacterium]|nr:carboxypeptidase regulatory-like domain-containing protein [Ignavibacteria bacterium]
MNLKLQAFFVFVLIVVCTTLVSSQTPPAPTNLTAFPGLFGGVALHWDSTSDANGYFIYKAVDDSPFRRIADTRHREFLDWYVYPGHSYAYFVTAFNLSGESSPSDTATFTLDQNPHEGRKVITGKVTDDSTGLPLREAVVRVFSQGGLWSQATHTDTGGVYWAALDSGDYLVRAEKYGYFPEWFDNVHRVDSATVIALHQDTVVTANFGLQPLPPLVPITVTGTVTDSLNGQPLSNAFVLFLRPHRWLREIEILTGLFGGFPFERIDLPEIGRLHGVVWIGRTDSSGNYSAHVVAGLRYIALAFKPGFVPKFYDNKHTPLEADRLFLTRDTSGINFSLVPNPLAVNTLSGAVTDSNGTGIPSHVILLRRTILGRLPVRFRMTDSVGNYTFYHLTNGTFYVKAIPVEAYAPAWYSAAGCGVANWHNADSIQVTGDVSGINICVVPAPHGGFARIAGEISHNPGNLAQVSPAEGVTVYAISNTTNQVVGYDVSESDGSYSIENLPAGTYNIVVDKEGYGSSSPPTYTVDQNNNYEVNNSSIIITPETPLSVGENGQAVPRQFRLDQNYPNPFNPSTQVRYDVAKVSLVSMKIYNLIGQEVAVLVNNTVEPGTYTVRWNGRDGNGRLVGSGIYFVKFLATPTDGYSSSYSQVRKMIMMK